MENVNASESEQWETSDSEDDLSDGVHRLTEKDDIAKSSTESENLSDIDDAEVDSYLNNEKEVHYKKKIWEIMNQKYVEDQAAKKVLAQNKDPNNKERICKRKREVKKVQSRARIGQSTSSNKRPSSRINHDALQKLFEEPVPSDNTNRGQTEPSFVQAHTNDDTQGTAYEPEDKENGWEEHPSYSSYNDQDDYYCDDEDFF